MLAINKRSPSAFEKAVWTYKEKFDDLEALCYKKFPYNMHFVHKYSIDRAMEEEACLSIKYKFQDFKWDLEVVKKWGLKEVEKMIKGEIPVNHSEASDEEIEVPLEQLSDIKEETHADKAIQTVPEDKETGLNPALDQGDLSNN